ncbi:MAG: HIT domain-containing protein [Bacilli bacterium]
MKDCLFCKISNNIVPSYTIYEDKTVKVILDISPSSNGHCLIITKTHYNNITDIPYETLAYINTIIKKMYALLEKKLNFDGMQILQNNGISQEIHHYHVHLIPRYKKETLIDTTENTYKKIMN